MGFTQEGELGFSMERGERQRRVAILLQDYRNLNVYRRTSRFRHGIAICDFIIAGLCVGGLGTWILVVWTFLRHY